MGSGSGSATCRGEGEEEGEGVGGLVSAWEGSAKWVWRRRWPEGRPNWILGQKVELLTSARSISEKMKFLSDTMTFSQACMHFNVFKPWRWH